MFLLDTNVLSELTRPAPNPGLIAFLKETREAYLSVMTIHELTHGIERLPTGQHRSGLEKTVTELLQGFGSQILPVNASVARLSAHLRVEAERSGRVLHVMDALIAATAGTHGLTVITRNEKNFSHLSVPVRNPWS